MKSTNKKHHLDLLISSQQDQADKGNLTSTGISYLNGLQRAREICFGKNKVAKRGRFRQ